MSTWIILNISSILWNKPQGFINNVEWRLHVDGHKQCYDPWSSSKYLWLVVFSWDTGQWLDRYSSIINKVCVEVILVSLVVLPCWCSTYNGHCAWYPWLHVQSVVFFWVIIISVAFNYAHWILTLNPFNKESFCSYWKFPSRSLKLEGCSLPLDSLLPLFLSGFRMLSQGCGLFFFISGLLKCRITHCGGRWLVG